VKSKDHKNRESLSGSQLMNQKNMKLTYSIKDDNAVPYFMWDYFLTNKEIRSILISSDEDKKIWLISKIMRDAKFGDLWELLDLEEILKYKNYFEHRLGRRKGLWDFLFEKYEEYGII